MDKSAIEINQALESFILFIITLNLESKYEMKIRNNL